MIEPVIEMMVFARVVEARGFSAAARQLGITKSAASKQVGRLEQALGARLLNRTTRKLSLTEAGAAVYEHCARIAAEAEAATLAAQRLSATPTGMLKIGASVAFGKRHIAPAIPEFLARYPEIKVHLVLADRFVDLAEEGFDVAIRLTRRLEDGHVARRIAPIRYAVCAAPSYLERAGYPSTPQALADHNCLFYAYESFQDVWRFQGPEGPVDVRVGGNFQVNSSEAIRDALLAGMGIGLVPTFAVGDDLAAGRLVRLLADYRPEGAFGAHAYAVYLPNRQLAPKVRVLIDFLIERFGEEPTWDRGWMGAGV